MSEFTRELALARDLAVQAGEAIEAVRKRGFVVSDKADSSPVTEADLAADRLIRAGLAAAFPDDAVLTEESAHLTGRSGRTWVIDPLDGTRAFIRDDVRGYAVQIGLLVGTTPVLGVVREPRHARTWSATYDVTAPTRATARPTDRRPRLITSTSIGADLLAAFAAAGFEPVPSLHSVGIKVGELLANRADAYFSHHPINAWDSCAPWVVLTAAGGTMTLADGQPLRYDPSARSQQHRGLVLASFGLDHADVVERAQAALDAYGAVTL